MKQSRRRVNSLLSVCASFALAACAGEIDVATYGESPALTENASPAPYGSAQQPAAPAPATAELTRNSQPSTNTASSNQSSNTSRSGSTRPRSESTTPSSTVTTTQAPAPSEPATEPTTATEAPAVVTQPSSQPVDTGVVSTSIASILWTDEIQTSESGNFGFNQLQLERPIGNSVSGSDSVNLTRVPNPIGPGFALKHVATFDNNGGSRSQAGIYSFANETFEKQVKSAEGIWIAQEWYFPEPLSAGNRLDSEPWVNVWDFHSVGAGERWDTQPGLMLAEDGSMRVKWTWRRENPETEWSQIDLPVGVWFDVEMHYVWTSSGGTVSLWINGELALEQHGVKTKGSTHNSVETYMKFYGSANGGTSWSPSPSVKYTRNVRIAGERIWR